MCIRDRITVMSLKTAGCFDCLFFGKCANERCSFNHDAETDESKMDIAIEKMQPGLTKFVELNN